MTGVRLRFDKVPGSFILDPENPTEVHFIPISGNHKVVNYIRVKDGRGSFYWSDSSREQFHGTGHGHFWRTPEGAIAFWFPFLGWSVSGWHYGDPEWIF